MKQQLAEIYSPSKVAMIADSDDIAEADDSDGDDPDDDEDDVPLLMSQVYQQG
jgi:hypothetical protein